MPNHRRRVECPKTALRRCAVALCRVGGDSSVWPAPLRRCAAPGLCRSSSARARRCAVAPCLVYYATLTCACAVAPLRRAAVLDLLRCQGAHMRRCAVAPLRRCLVLGLRCNWSRRLRSAAMQLRPVQRSNGATERSCAAAARTLWHGATERGAAERSCAAAARSTGTEVRSRATEHGATEGSCAAAAKAHGARSTERSIGVRSEAI